MSPVLQFTATFFKGESRMATIEKRTTKEGETSYRVKVRLRGYPVQSASFGSLTLARRWGQQTESAIREGRHFKTAEAKKHTLNEMIDRYLNQELSRRPKTKKDQERHFVWWKKEIGTYLLSDITPALIVQCRDKLSNGSTQYESSRANGTVNRYLAALSKCFTIGVKEWGWLEENPVRKVSKFSEPRGRVRFLNDDERKQLLDVCKKSENPYLYPIVLVALSTGARKNEVLTLTWDQIDLRHRTIILHETKNGERRALPITNIIYKLLEEHAKIRRIDSKLLFPSSTPNTPVSIRNGWVKALQEAKIEDFRFHDLRHSAASYLAMNGATPGEIAAVLGHKTLQMVKRYSHLSEAHTANVVAKMNERIFG